MTKEERLKEIREKMESLKAMITAIDAKIKEKIDEDTQAYRLQSGESFREEKTFTLTEIMKTREVYQKELKQLQAQEKLITSGRKTIVFRLNRF